MTELKSQEQLKRELSAPLPPEAVKPHPTKPYLSSIKAIYVTERLNDVFGIGAWRNKVRLVKMGEGGMVVVKVILTVPAYGIYYECFGGNDNGGENSKNFDLGDAFKGASTDAITKICSYLGIGIQVFKGLGNTQPKEPASRTTPPPVQYGPEIFKEIQACFKNEALAKLWDKYPSLQANAEFKSKCAERKSQLALSKLDLPQ